MKAEQSPKESVIRSQPDRARVMVGIWLQPHVIGFGFGFGFGFGLGSGLELGLPMMRSVVEKSAPPRWHSS